MVVVGGGLSLVLGYGVVRIATAEFRDGPRLALLQTNIKQELKLGEETEVILAEFRRLVAKAMRTGPKPDLIVWPETSYPRGFPLVEPGLDDSTYLTWIKAIHPRGTLPFWRQKAELVRTELYDWVDQLDTPMLIGTTTYWFRPDGFSRFNSAILLQPGQGPETGPRPVTTSSIWCRSASTCR